jgi:integrase
MPAYKDEKQNSWYCQFYYVDWQGNRKKKQKRGFKTKKEALEWENNFKLSANASMDMTLGAFVEIYYRDKEGELKERTFKNKKYLINTHILPYFGNKPMNSITPSDIIQWQNEIRAKGFKPTYLRMIQNNLTALFTHASRIYNLANNPCKKVKKMGKSDADKLDFWTKDEYDEFIGSIEVGSRYYVLFEVLFWTGARSGEVLALTKSDIDLKHNRISISKTYYRTDRRDIITAPKTEQSIRVIDIPEFLTEELETYMNKLYELPDDERIFPIVEEAVQHKLKRQCEKTGVKKIRVHDIRHSHVAFLIHQGVQPLVIKERLGHKDIKITMNTYGHLYPNQQKAVADMLNLVKTNEIPTAGTVGT